MEGFPGIERRACGSRRIKVSRPVAIFAEGREGIIRGRTRNISTGGCSIGLDEVLEIGEKVLFRIDLGEGFEPAVQSAEVVWADRDKGQVGLRFFLDSDSESESRNGVKLPPPGSMVRVEIEHVEKPIKVIFDSSEGSIITLKTRVPFLEIGKSLAVVYSADEGGENVIYGKISDVIVEKHEDSNVPFIKLNVKRDRVEVKRQPDRGRDGEQREQKQIVKAEGLPGEVSSDNKVGETVSENPEVNRKEESSFRSEAVEQSKEGDRVQSDGSSDPFEVTPYYLIFLEKVFALAKETVTNVMTKGRQWVVFALPFVAVAFRKGVKTVLDSSRVLIKRWRRKRQRRSRRSVISAGRFEAGGGRRRWAQVALFGICLVTFVVGVWGAIGVIKESRSDEMKSTGLSGAVDSSSASSFQKTAYPNADGDQPGMRKAETSYDLWNGGVVAAPASGQVSMGREMKSHPAKSSDDKAGSANPVETGREEIKNSDIAQVVSDKRQVSSDKTETIGARRQPVVDGKSINLLFEGKILGFRHYPLKTPPGIVVDVKGVVPAIGRSVMVFSDSKVLKRIKAIGKDGGARYIVIFKTQRLPRYEIIAHSNKIEVKLM